MKYRKLMVAAIAAILGASVVQEASAWGTGGAVTTPRKTDFSNYDLFCDLDRVSFGGDTILEPDRVKILTRPSALDPLAPGESPSLTFSGQMFCAEVPQGTSNPKLEDAVNGLVGRFRLVQQSPAQRPTSTLTQTETGLVYTGPDANGVRTWTFRVPADSDLKFPFPELLYDLETADAATAAKFCDQGVEVCKALFGIQVPAKAADYTARDLDGDNVTDLLAGEVFSFSTKTTMLNGVASETPGKFYWGVCHNQAFITPTTPIVVKALDNSSHDGGQGVPTPLSLNVGDSLGVTVNENDLWNSGSCSPSCRWSNADGQIREMKGTGHDDSGKPAGTIIGVDWKTKHGGSLAGNLLKWNGSDWESVSDAAYGTLVGSNGTGQFFILGTSFYGPSPQAALPGELKLFYWDTPRDDNSQFVTASLDKPIRCTTAQGQPALAQGAGAGLGKVNVKGFPTLNVSNKSSKAVFPFTVIACNVGEETIAFAADGNPIVTTGNVRVRLSTGDFSNVAINGFSVADNVSLPSCDSGAALADLALKLNNKDFINAVVPGTSCQSQKTDETVEYVVRLNTTNGGSVEGKDTVALSNCKRF